MSAKKLEERVAALEAEVQDLKVSLNKTSEKKGWEAFVGAFENDEMSRKAAKYGREWRESQKPKAKRAKK